MSKATLGLNRHKYVCSVVRLVQSTLLMPQNIVITDDDYKERQLPIFESDIRLFVYNIDKFNKEGANMKKVNEMIGNSFYQYLSNLPDLVLIMDESHHYRVEKGAQALNELNPLLGLELTATPLVAKGTKQVPFKNVVFEYPLSKAIADGYTRTPFAVTRSDIDFYNFGDEQLDKMMLLDVESEDNPVEIVIHVNILKGGWDVNNLYTIVPLRTAASKILRDSNFRD